MAPSVGSAENKKKNFRKRLKFRRPKPIPGVNPIYNQFPNYDDSLIDYETGAWIREDKTRALCKEFPEGYFTSSEHNKIKAQVRYQVLSNYNLAVYIQ